MWKLFRFRPLAGVAPFGNDEGGNGVFTLCPGKLLFDTILLVSGDTGGGRRRSEH